MLYSILLLLFVKLPNPLHKGYNFTFKNLGYTAYFFIYKKIKKGRIKVDPFYNF